MPLERQTIIIENVQLRESFSGVVGQSRNARMSIAAASSTATFAADELIVETSTGQQYRISSFNKTVNLSTTGAGGMDTGMVPTEGFVALYAILNPTNGATALLAVNATTTIAPEIYGGANLPSGYTASALVSVWRVASSQFTVGFQFDRKITFPRTTLLTTSTNTTAYTQLSISTFVPKNAISITGGVNVNPTSPQTNNYWQIAADAAGSGEQFSGTNNSGIMSAYTELPIITAQQIYYIMSTSGVMLSSYIYCTGYRI